MYIIICRECDPDLEAPIPFSEQRERGKYVDEHTKGTGHNSWFISESKSIQEHRKQQEGLFNERNRA